MKRLVYTLVVVLLSLPTLARAEPPLTLKPDRRDAPQMRAAAEAKANAEFQKKREWLRLQLIARLDDPRQIRDVEQRLAQASPEQVDELIALYQQQKLQEAKQELEQARAYRDQLQLQYQQRMQAQNFGGPAPGFAPFITVLPQGAQLHASAVVSPDRRYVRVSAFPFFSSIGPVHTFNLYNGQYQRLPQFDPPPPPSAHVDVWYDGLRTRTDPRPKR
jgi:hypothetical protein